MSESHTEQTLNEVIEWMENKRKKVQSRMLVWEFDYGNDTKVTITTEVPPEKWKKQETANE